MKLAGLLCLGMVVAAVQPLWAQAPQACGAEKQDFEVKLDGAQHAIPAAESGKALLVFVQDTGRPGVGAPALLARVGVDGSWVGALKNESWFSIAVEPGIRHLCVLNQPRISSKVTELLQLRVEPGRTYYIRVRNLTWHGSYMELGETNEDQGAYMVSASPMARAEAKK